MIVGRENFALSDSLPHTSGCPAGSRRIAFIACPWTFYEAVEFRSQQLGLGYVGAYAEQCGHKIAAFIDPMIGGGENWKTLLRTKYQTTNRFGFSDEWIVEQIPADADIVGINAPFTDSRLVLYPLVKRIKAVRPDLPVVVGGVLATALPHQVLEESGADIIVKGEGEIAFARILNGEPLEGIPGLVFKRRDGSVFENAKRSEQLKDLVSMPVPGYHFRPMEEYIRWSPRGDKADRTLSLVSSRGCPFTCEFCSIPEKGQRWRAFGAGRIIAEIDAAIERWEINHFEFEDDNFTLKEDRAAAILAHLRQLRRRGVNVRCSFPNGVMIDRMSRELVSLMKEAGADIIYLPVESGDERILFAMDKPDAPRHLAKTKEVAGWCVEVGLLASCFFIVAYPGGRIKRARYENTAYAKYYRRDGEQLYITGEDRKSFEITMRFCRELQKMGVRGITPLIATPYPGTELYDFCRKFGLLAFEDDKDTLTTVSYAAVRPDMVQIESPWCSRQEAYDRWKEMMNAFPTFHNVRKSEGSDKLLSGKELQSQ